MNIRSSILTGLGPILIAAVSLPAAVTYDMTVAKDGSGTHKTVQSAFTAAPKNSTSRTVIYIKNGTYKENLTLESSQKNVTIIGQNRDNVKLTFNNYSSKTNPATGQTYGTSGSASTFIKAEGFCAVNITFENSYGTGSQALAINISGDKTIFYNCRFLGRQDTWYADRCRQFIRNCYIEGSTDFMFGPSTTWFDSCQIYTYGGSALTAASTEQYVSFGYVFRDCSIGGASGVSTTLGRPWRPYSSVSYLNCSMTSCIKAAGWDNWGKTENEATARYSEYKNTGSGASISGRVKWAKQLSDAQAANYTYKNVLKTTYANPPKTDNWDPLTTLELYLPKTTRIQQRYQVSSQPPDVSVLVTTGFRNLSISGMKTGTPVTVSVYTINGKIVHRQETIGKSSMILPMQGSAKGVYIVSNGIRGK